MTWNYAYSPNIWPSILSALLLLALAVYGVRRRTMPGVTSFVMANLFAATWAMGSVMEFSAISMSTRIFWVKFQAAWMLPSSTAMTCFVLEYAWPGRWLTRRNLALLSIPPLLVLGMILTDHVFHLMWRTFNLDGSVFPQLGQGGWIGIIYSYGLVFLNIGLLAWLFLKSPIHRWPVAIMLTGHIVFRLLFFLQRANLIHFDLPLDLIGLAFLALTYAIALFGFRIFDPTPLARQVANQQLRDGMLVMDSQKRVVSLNPAAERILDASAKQVQGKPIADLLPNLPQTSALQTSLTALQNPIELSLDQGAERHYYELDFAPLNDFRGLNVGHLLLLHDVTEQRRSQEQILNQQRAMATLKERERLAHELHDELAQDLALINLQAQLVSGLLEAGQAQQAQAQLQILAGVAREAQVDVRTEISKLSHRITQAHGLPGALQQLVDTFQQTYGTETELVLPEVDQKISIPANVEVQLLRITQEAFTNIRKHARAKNASVALTLEPEHLRLVIADDGVGFDSQSLPVSHHSFGLGVMSARAQEVNGKVDVQSTPGTGTRVTVIIPMEAA
jgi:PAS domain S-box-containing protein